MVADIALMALKMKIMLQAKGIKKNYGTLEVLKGIDFSVAEGEIVTIIGKSGAGKSTFLHILGTLDIPDQGELSFEGKKVDFSNESALSSLRNEKLGFIFQFHHLLNEFTAWENVCIPAMIRGGEKMDNLKSKAEEYLSYLGLQDRMNHKPNALSGGEAQRVAIARALMNRPKLILADEPTGNLDKVNSEEMHKLFIKLRDDFGQSFVIVTHNLELAALSDRTIRMEDGYIIS
jgi:lipoprotein-releasing system ATP-binding protein